MFSIDPSPDNPWPHDMVITIEDTPQILYELLWIREAWGLNVAGADLPPLLARTPALVNTARPASIAEWSDAWPQLWQSCLTHAGEVRDPTVFDRLTNGAIGSAERASLLDQLTGPSWRDRFGDEAFTTDYEQWSRAQLETLMTRKPMPYEKSPELKALDALVPAWRAGLSQLVLIPCRGTFTRRIGQAGLLLTEETRNDPTRYAEALRSVT